MGGGGELVFGFGGGGGGGGVVLFGLGGGVAFVDDFRSLAGLDR